MDKISYFFSTYWIVPVLVFGLVGAGLGIYFACSQPPEIEADIGWSYAHGHHGGGRNAGGFASILLSVRFAWRKLSRPIRTFILRFFDKLPEALANAVAHALVGFVGFGICGFVSTHLPPSTFKYPTRQMERVDSILRRLMERNPIAVSSPGPVASPSEAKVPRPPK